MKTLQIKILNRVAVFFISSYLILMILFIKYYKININSQNKNYNSTEIHFRNINTKVCGKGYKQLVEFRKIEIKF